MYIINKIYDRYLFVIFSQCILFFLPSVEQMVKRRDSVHQKYR